MKGPGFRYDLDIRRVWECPHCKRRVRYLGHVTSRRCSCDEEGHWMQIVDENVRRAFPEREKIVIPEEYAEETREEQPTVTEVTPQPEISEAQDSIETTEPPAQTDASPPATETSPQQSSDNRAQTSPDESQSEEQTGRKKRRKKRRRKKSRNKSPEASQNPEPKTDSPPPSQTENPQSDPGRDDFGTNVF